jgi:hypothetical protein
MKEEFKQMVKTKSYPLEWFYKYYHTVGGHPIDIHTFYQWFQMLDFNVVLDSIGRYFGLNRLFDKTGKLILVYEY